MTMPWGTGGSIRDPRYIQKAPATMRRRCTCGCEQRATFLGMANGVCLTMGCELFVRRWVKDPANAISARARFRQRRAEAEAAKRDAEQPKML